MKQTGVLIAALIMLGAVRSAEWQSVGPFNVHVLEGSIGVERVLGADAAIAAPNSPWSITGWVCPIRRQSGRVVIAAVGDASASKSAWRGVELLDGEIALQVSPAVTLRSGTVTDAGQWYSVAASYDGLTARLYVNGRESAEISAATPRVSPKIQIAPRSSADTDNSSHFGGSLAQIVFDPGVREASEAKSLFEHRPDFSLMTYEDLGVGWPLQEHAWRGLQVPQDAWTLPRGKSAARVPVADEALPAVSALKAQRPGLWTLMAWRLIAEPEIAETGETLSRPGYSDARWHAAVVPGTVLTTLIARGVYPDPDYGLDNLAIPDSLSRQNYWYRTVFDAPQGLHDRQAILTFNGINYVAQIWLNGVRLGSIEGAFMRGTFDVSSILRLDGPNVLAVRIAPPPHPGIPHEQSVAAGPGENGGMLALDGPTFIASEGWDWIPGIRDRNAGIWQSVELRATGALRLRDPQVISHLPLPRIDTADIVISVPVQNGGTSTVTGALVVDVDSVRIRKTVSLPVGTTTVTLDPAEFPQLHLIRPRLWWPNGYGEAELHNIKIELDEGAVESDRTEFRFGIRELTYEMSLFDHEGRLRRVEIDPAKSIGEPLVDERHAAIKRTANGWAASLTPAGDRSSAVRPAAHESLSPYLVLKVNGVPIAARGGSWGMDDSRKRSSRERLEPYFQLHRDAHLNIIRNWLGQNTEEVFYELADEYGLLVLNDFWESTQDFQLEAQDPALFLANARDVISRYRNHPSIAVWFGRNEGMPQPIINEGLAELTSALDGTRHYMGSSNSINLQGSGPYNYRSPDQYFTGLARGFSVEVGTPSLSTLESIRASIPPADRWPLGDAYAYHDWHFGGNGDVASFMTAMKQKYGAPESLEDFERKAQLMDYVSYRAIFEGFAAHLWTENSGRLLWMSHPAWPSNTWQIYSSDYDTGAAYYAVKKACEPIHAQMNLPDYRLAVVNTTQSSERHLLLRTRVVSLENRTLSDRIDRVDAPSNAVSTLAVPLELHRLLGEEGVVLVKLTLTASNGSVLSDNVYWQARDEQSERRLNDMPAQPIAMSSASQPEGSGSRVEITLIDRGAAPALAAKITMLAAGGARALPVYYSDNYVTLMPGEVKKIVVHCPSAAGSCARAGLRGWNIAQQEILIGR